MPSSLFIPLLALGLLACLGLETMGFAMSASGHPDDIFLVIGPPWDGGVDTIIVRSGGRVVGPASAPLSVLATGASPAAFGSAGAWLVLDPAALDMFCGMEAAI